MKNDSKQDIMDNSGTISIQLNKLNDVSVVDVRGRKCVVVPVNENGIYISEKGTIVLSFFMSKMREEQWGKTHTLKRKLNKEEYNTWTKEQRDNNPVAGYFEPWRQGGGYNNNGSGYAQPTYNALQAQSPAPNYGGNNNGGGVGDLPF